MSSCLPGNPRIFLSAPHFRHAPKGLRKSIDGICNTASEEEEETEGGEEEEDDSFYDIEPYSGVAVHVQQRFQMNIGMLKGNFK